MKTFLSSVRGSLRPLALLFPLCTAAATLSDCGSQLDGTMNESRALAGLRISPDNDILLVDFGQKVEKSFRVYATYGDGTSEDVSSQVVLTMDNAALGTLSGGVFTSAAQSTARVEFARIEARLPGADPNVVGIANLTVVWLRLSGGTPDFFFTLPFDEPEQAQPLAFSTKIQSLDSFFVVDTTASMAPEINQLSASLQNVIIPAVKAAAAKDAWFGVGAHDDFPINPYGVLNVRGGYPDDQPFILLQPMTADIAAAQSGVGQLLVGATTRGNGGDYPESQLEALYQIATGAGNLASPINVPAHNTKGIGGVEFRSGALPVVTLITDAAFHTKGEPGSGCTVKTMAGTSMLLGAEYGGAAAAAAHSRTETAAALKKICAKVIGVSALRTQDPNYMTDPNGICSATQDLRLMAQDTGAVVPPAAWDYPSRPAGCAAGQCCTGIGGIGEATDANGQCPLVFKIPQDGTGLGTQVASAIAQLSRYASFEVTTSVSGLMRGEKGESLPTGKTTADFIKMVSPLDSMPPPPPASGATPKLTATGFSGVVPGSSVRFSIKAKNDFQPLTGIPQVYRATIKVLAGGCADLDQRDVIILIPPKPPVSIG